MTTDSETDKVYFSEWLRSDFPKVAKSICAILESHGVEYGFLKHTKDYWCRDYMPVQVNKGKFVKYRYKPDYLADKTMRRYATDPADALAELGISTESTDLVIDGGNVIRCPEKVIMTEKVFRENGDKPRMAVAKELERLFEAELVVLPWDASEALGHADGIVRWISAGRVLLTAYEESRHFANRFETELARHFDVVKMKFTSRPRHRSLTWAYVNFLQTSKAIVVPAFGIKEDAEALTQINSAYPDYGGRIEQTDVSGLVRLGGALNCISWNIATT